MHELLIEKIKTKWKQIRLKMSTFDAYFSKGLELYDKQKFNLAVEFFKIALSQSNAQDFAYYNLALSYQQLDKNEDALKNYENFLKFYPKDQSGLYNTALIYYKQKNYEQAQKYFLESFKITQDEENVRALTKAYLHLGETQKVLDLVEYIFNSDCDNNLAYIVAQVLETKQYLISDLTYVEYALNIYLRLLEFSPKNFKYAFSASVSYSKMGNWEKSTEFCSKALEIEPKSYDANSQMGLVYYCLEDMNNAVFYYEKAFKLNSKDYNIYSNLAYAYEKAGREEYAISIFKEMLTKFSNFPTKDDVRKHVRQLIEKTKLH